MIQISVVVPTYNRLDSLRRCLDALCAQTFPADRFEVVVVSDGSTDGTKEFLEGFSAPFKVVTLFQPNRGVAAARNNGFRNAGGEIILFVDDDIAAEPCLVAEHVSAHADYGENAVIIGPMLTPTDHSMSVWVRWEQQHLEEYYHAMTSKLWESSPRMFYTGNSSLRKKYLLQSGGFDPSFRRAEDVELAYRLADLGMEFHFNPAARAFHYAERSFEAWLKVAYEYGKNDVLFATRKGQEWLIPTICREFYTRNPLIRWMVRMGLDRARLNSPLLGLMKIVVRGAGRSVMTPWQLLACSGLFNFYYYQGMSDQMGGRGVFIRKINKARQGGNHV